MAKQNTRQHHILEMLAREGEVSVEDLASRLDVSVMTVRRDLSVLSRAGSLSRTHGGAMLSRAGTVEFSFHEKGNQCAEAKQAVAQAVARLVKPGMAISLDTGTTTLQVARAITEIEGLTVLTTSLAIASALYVHENIRLVLLGGTVRKGSPDLSGPLTEENLRHFRVDLAVLGADAACSDGVFTNDINVARVSGIMIEAAGKAVLAVDSSKFTQHAFVKYADWNGFAMVVTNDDLVQETRHWLKETGVDVDYVPRKVVPEV